MSAPRPYETDPFHPLGSIPTMKQFLYINNIVPVISSMWYVQMFVYDNCACALNLTTLPAETETVLVGVTTKA